LLLLVLGKMEQEVALLERLAELVALWLIKITFLLLLVIHTQ
jgi:hypothetical protein